MVSERPVAPVSYVTLTLGISILVVARVKLKERRPRRNLSDGAPKEKTPRRGLTRG
jgi:hypothetical protein